MKLPKKILIFLSVLIIFINPWWWVIVQKDLLIGILVFILSIITPFFYNGSKFVLFFLILNILLISTIFRQALDESIFRLSPQEIQQQNKRHEFYAHNLGKVYKNRISLSYFKNYNYPLYKVERNFFANLDPNLYFFASHPRERVEVNEFEKYMFVFLPFFVIGLTFLIYSLRLKIISYLISILFLSAFISSSYKLGPILLFPIINFMIVVGLLLSFKFALKYKNV